MSAIADRGRPADRAGPRRGARPREHGEGGCRHNRRRSTWSRRRPRSPPTRSNSSSPRPPSRTPRIGCACSSTIRPIAPSGAVTLEPIDTPPTSTTAVDLDAAVTTRSAAAPTSTRAQGHRQRRRRIWRCAGNQRLPDVRLNASYQANGLGGTQVQRTRRLSRHDRRPRRRSRGSARCSTSSSSTTTPRGRPASTSRTRSAEQRGRRNYARTQTRAPQADERVKSAEGARHPGGAHCGLEDRDERQAHGDDPRRRASSPTSGSTPSGSGSRSGCRRASW